MKNYGRRNYFVLILFVFVVMLFGVFKNDALFSLLLLGVMSLIVTSFVKSTSWQRFFRWLGGLLIVTSLVMARGFILLIGLIIIGFWLWRYRDLFELWNIQVNYLFRQEPPTYHQLKVIEPQSIQRHSLEVKDIRPTMQSTYYMDDLNLVYFGGDQIIDFGHTVLTAGETVVIVRKIFGRTRIILPQELGVRINVTALSGQVKIDQERIDLSSQQLTWQNDHYSHSQRQVRLFISVAFGEVEVSFL